MSKGYAIATERDNGCIICRSPYIHRHHVIFRSKGGNDSEMNIVCLCSKHHSMAHSHQRKWETICIEYLETHYGHIDKESLMKKTRYSNLAFPRK